MAIGIIVIIVFTRYASTYLRPMHCKIGDSTCVYNDHMFYTLL